MPHFSLMLPHDGSRFSGAVVDVLEPLVKPGASVLLLHVDEGHDLDESALAETEKRLTALGAVVEHRKIEASDPAGAIVDAAATERPALVAMTAHGRSGTRLGVRGGVAERVLRACPVPLLMVNPSTHGTANFRSVLVPLEASAESAEILATLIPLAQAYESRITLLFVDFDDPTDTPTMRARRREARKAPIEDWIGKERERLQAVGLKAEVRIAQGDPAERILALATPADYNLVAMTTHARSGVRRWLLGSVAEKVLRECRLPVLLHRNGLADPAPERAG